MKPRTDDELGPWLALFCVPNLSLRLTHKLLQYFETPAAILAATEQELRDFRVKPMARVAIVDYQRDRQKSDIGIAAEKILSWRSSEADHHIVHWTHPEYPKQLREIAQSPLILFVAGNPRLLNQPQLAFVGSRNPSADGKRLAHEFARQLSVHGLLITSGLALGIDSASHAGALAANAPTIAVMATGIDHIYPRRHQPLAQKIRETGALISEFPLGHQPTPQSFPQRNRIISGLSLGVLVVEAAIKSGSLITARYALEQNREVFAIPGSIHNPVAKGCHQLIRQGAKLVESAQDILEEIAFAIDPDAMAEPVSSAKTVMLTAEQKQVMEQIGYSAVNADELVDRTEIAVIQLAGILTQLCLLGLIEQTEHGFVRVFDV